MEKTKINEYKISATLLRVTYREKFAFARDKANQRKTR